MCAQLESLLIVRQGAPGFETLSRALEDNGHHVTLADPARPGTGKLNTNVDLVFLEFAAPGLDASAVIRKFKAGERWPKPLLVLFGEDDPQLVRRLFDLGADDFLDIPLNVPLLEARSSSWVERKQLYELHRAYQEQIHGEKQRADDLLKIVIPLGVALSAEKDFNRLLETILLQAKGLCNADAGTLYLRTPEDTLKFMILRNDTLKLALGGTTGKPIAFPPLPLYDPQTHEPNHKNIATYTALSGTTVNVLDAYEARGFDFSGTRKFDGETGYRSTSFLTVPLKEHDDVLGVLQLINAQELDSARVTYFDSRIHPVIESLALLATVALKAYLREERMAAQIEQLQIQVDEARKTRQVTEIVESDYFQSLQRKAGDLKRSFRAAGHTKDVKP